MEVSFTGAANATPASGRDANATRAGQSFDAFMDIAGRDEIDSPVSREAPEREELDRERAPREDEDPHANEAARGRTERRDAEPERKPVKRRGEARGRGGGERVDAERLTEAVRKAAAGALIAKPGEDIEPDTEVLRSRNVADLLARLTLDQRGAVLQPMIDGEGGGDTVNLSMQVLDEAAADALLDQVAELKPTSIDGDGPTTLRILGPNGQVVGKVEGMSSITPAAATLRLPPNVEPSTVMRQISDALSLKHGLRNQTAEIELHPAELGRVRLRVQMEQGAVRVLVAAEHAGVSDLLAANLEQLRQQLLAQGMQSAEVHVEVGDFELAHGGAQDSEGEGGGEEGEVEETGGAPEAERPSPRTHDGRISVRA